MSLRSLLRHRATLKRPATATSAGRVTVSYSTVGTNIPCLIQERIGTIQTGPSGQHLQYQAVGFFFPDLDIRPTGATSQPEPDQIEHNGTTYAVIHVGDEAGQDHHKTAFLRREGRAA